MYTGYCGIKILLHSSLSHQLHIYILRSSKTYSHFCMILLTVVMSLKSRHPPQTKRFTVASLEVALIAGKYSSTSLLMASRDSEVALSPVYLHLHSRHTLSNDMAPLARGTAFADMLLLCMDIGKKQKLEHIINHNINLPNLISPNHIQHSPRECATSGRSKSGGAGSNSGEEKASNGGLHGANL